MRLLITGTPCTGKTTLALALSGELGCPLLRVNDAVEQLRCYHKNRRGEKEVDLSKLQKHLEPLLETFKGKDFIAEGHLLCDMKLPCEKVLVLRCHPSVLEKRMKKRGYSKQKISDNIVSEIIDYPLVNCELNYGKKKVLQLNFTKPLSEKAVISRLKPGKGDFVDWTPLLLRMRFSALASGAGRPRKA